MSAARMSNCPDRNGTPPKLGLVYIRPSGDCLAVETTSARVSAGKSRLATNTRGARDNRLMPVKSLTASYGIFGRRAAVVNRKLPTDRIVYPSAGALAAASAPMTPPAPGLFSTTTGCPRRSAQRIGDDPNEYVAR